MITQAAMVRHGWAAEPWPRRYRKRDMVVPSMTSVVVTT